MSDSPTERPDTVVFIPAWNEEASLPAALAELHTELPGADSNRGLQTRSNRAG